MDWRYEYWSASAVSSARTNSVVPSLRVRTGTGVASATPAAVTTAATSATRALLRPGEAGRSRTVTRCGAADDHLFLPDTLRLIKIDRALVVVDRRTDDRRFQGEVIRGGVDLHQIGLVVEHRREDRLGQRRIEARRHDQKVGDSRYGHVGSRVVCGLRDLDREVEVSIFRRHLLDAVR